MLTVSTARQPSTLFKPAPRKLANNGMTSPLYDNTPFIAPGLPGRPLPVGPVAPSVPGYPGVPIGHVQINHDPGIPTIASDLRLSGWRKHFSHDIDASFLLSGAHHGWLCMPPAQKASQSFPNHASARFPPPTCTSCSQTPRRWRAKRPSSTSWYFQQTAARTPSPRS